MIEINNHIILDQKKTWPEVVLDLINNSKKDLENYLIEESQIDKLGRTDLNVRYNRPHNPYFEKWDEITDKIERILKKYNLVGIHCTKLMDYEIDDILVNGLRPLNKDFANKRIKILYENGLISNELKNKIYDKEELSAENRSGKVFTFHSLSTLKDEWGLNRLFGYWGGESIYSYVKQAQELKDIGTSCIVIVSIQIKNFDIYPELSKRMLSIYFDSNYCPHDNDSIFEEKLDVLQIIKREDELFNRLTNIEAWSDEI